MRYPLDDLNFIECFEQDGRKLYIGKMDNNQIELYEAMVISLQISLHHPEIWVINLPTTLKHTLALR